ncbi:uncharacterized protein FOMMEDRAFT_152269 [Fomitiporia mediterranea MF3/22]|uniref:uncharacterized protein n=1 Tax=Fomitiporia mediterranea (strain MF3/22) TaxID=694068 RepID=UPI0004408522|nr:uncharacterized protein FOMMEDRAFT_152269 [Fomitiporia mediterranea MF3/22]EJD06932.1 hypothetical protein FOMMEDRAFT_152269 [Fomitiporia mediterranea MF3/22]
MATQLTVLVRPRLWLMPLRTEYEQIWEQRGHRASYEGFIRMILSWLSTSKLMVHTRQQYNSSQGWHTSTDASANVYELPEPEEFVPSENDPIHIPPARQDYYLKLFRGFVRIFVADRPFYDSRGPPEWSVQYKALYDICGRMYAQNLTEDGYSVLHPARVLETNKVTELRVNSWGIIGRRTMDETMKVKIFEEASPFSETEFSALPPPRPICKRPTNVTHVPGCN